MGVGAGVDASILLDALFPNQPSDTMDPDSVATPASEDTAYHVT